MLPALRLILKISKIIFFFLLKEPAPKQEPFTISETMKTGFTKCFSNTPILRAFVNLKRISTLLNTRWKSYHLMALKISDTYTSLTAIMRQVISTLKRWFSITGKISATVISTTNNPTQSKAQWTLRKRWLGSLSGVSATLQKWITSRRNPTSG